ncbi:DEAD-box ATP-dependent RNA helicase FANCM-like isoform X1 [Vicia villosa]|uniref:DEAD-box ATP-dependent RNA helicase FANCM-like isoform X1 n=2 Tax=Vicia villosa TaxID=3911 RepID=UPI00273A82E6|nr:DEAD-box ATP-dependent RNA helicase FANCM-like isoform X1 [Vicia villosa]
MDSNNPYEILDDDDGFDWEAAAREIDAVCEMRSDAKTNGSEAEKVCQKGKGKGKGKRKQSTLDNFVGIANKETETIRVPENDCEESICNHPIDTEAAKTWIYPVNVPLRDYQFHIAQTALFQNTLVALPTGLGKTLIAAVVMYNYFRWFPEGKIVFAAPSRPLVMQQIEACHNIAGIPQEWTVDMTGQLSPPKRARLWKTKRVFFVTPQVLEKDIHSGKCLVKYLVCLVIDEAHRAMGNYSYCEAVRELMAVPVQLRILALTATPGSKQQTVQDVIDNLHISKLEHRSETDHDVMPYVHDRKIELIQVAMGEDAVEINNKFLEVIRPIVTKLTNIGAIQNRDYRTLSPCVLLEMREKFRQGQMQDPSHNNYIDVEGYFGVLITLYYIHKLLSSHGIRPAYEMLERKLKQGFFAKYMSKNEDILKARQLMDQSLSHGASSPKLSKMLEVLLEHFKTNDPQNSRVIIFSNFRESVRDIMAAIGGTGDQIRATEFIGQSSGKTTKGQSQKVQQAVLKKFRSGAYNVIVATSIGEEGLDIMEVDLVISFDANISPLRMIQRMGRTGRKHDGRVVVLACEGAELKGYLKKKAKGKTISKHMRNGGINSFVFHPSPRMIPHIFKPEVQYVELSIEKFIPRQNNVRENHLQISASKDKLTLAETDLLEKYFHSTGENRCRLSLIAFPHSQTFPSRVHKVKHSCGTLMFIDMMQRLQGLAACAGDSKNSTLQEGRCLGNSKPHVSTELDEAKNDNRDTTGINIDSENRLEVDSCHMEIQIKDFVDLTLPDNTFSDTGECQEETADGDETIPETPDAKRILSNEGANATEIANSVEKQTSSLAADACDNGMRDEELSPRLTNLIISGVVPESPIEERGKSRNRFVIRGCISPVHLQEEQDAGSLSCRETENVIIDSGNGKNVCTSPVNDNDNGKAVCTSPVYDSGNGKNVCTSPVYDSDNGKNVCTSPVNETRTPLLELKNCAIRRGRVFVSQIEERHMHTVGPSISEESHPSCGEMSVSIKPARKFKRLRKIEDTESNMNQKNNNIFDSTANFSKPAPATNPTRYHGQGIKKPANVRVRDFIEEEAEVSSDASVSNDEDAEDDNSVDSFIDDQTNLTAATQPGASRMDMMAIYRRSLLSQTPMNGGPRFSTTFSPDNVTMTASIGESGNSSVKTVSRFQTEHTSHSANRTSESISTDCMTSEAGPSTSVPTETDIRSRKRRLTFHNSGHFPSVNLEHQFALQSKKESVDTNATIDVLCDDQFLNTIDLDELEAQATSILKRKSDSSNQKQDVNPQSHEPNLDVIMTPSFDLGI